MTQIQLNNTLLQTEHQHLNSLLTAHHYPTQSIAVIINGQLISSAQYSQTLLQEGDVIEIMLPMQGG